MAETRTDLLVQAKAKGFQEVQQQASKVIDAAAKATTNQIKGFAKLEGAGRAYKKEIKALEPQLIDLTKQQLATTRAMEGMAKGSKVYQQLGQNLREINTQYSKLAGMRDKLKELFGPRGGPGQPLTAKDMARGGFMQGLVQGGLHVDLQRGPGMWRQAAGMATGTMLRGFAGAPFGGVGGVQQGLAGIPGVGGFLAGQFGTAMGFGEGALGVQQARLGALPLFGAGRGNRRRVQEAQARAAEGVRVEDYTASGQFLTPDVIAERAAAAGKYAAANVKMTPEMQAQANATYREMFQATARRQAEESGWRGKPTEEALALAERVKRDQLSANTPLRRKLWETAQASVLKPEQEKAREQAETGMREILTTPEKRYREAVQDAERRAGRRERGRPFAEVKRIGRELGGMSEQEAIQAVSPLLQRAGGGIQAAQQQNMIRAAISAQTVYGVGAETSGAFLGAGRRGGMVGAQGRGGETLAATIGDALRLGLEGSELTDYLQQMANGFENWKQTGIPINPKSIASLSSTFATQGLGGVRGGVMGQRFAQAGQRLTQTGIQDAIDLMMLQTVGGYQGGGMEQYMESMKKLESTQMGGEDLQKMIRQIYETAGGGATGTWTVREALGRKGMQMGVGEAELFVKSATGQKLTEQEQAKLAEQQQQMNLAGQQAPKGVAGLATQAQDLMDTYGGAVKRAAALQNKQNSIGESLLPTLQNLQASSANINKAFQILSDDTLNKAAKQIEKFTAGIERLSNMLDDKNTSGWSKLEKLMAGAF